MKASIFFITLLFTTLTWAQSACLGDICIGQKAIDTFNRVGTISRIEGTRIFYVTESGSELSGSTSSLSPEQASSRFPVNGGVIDNFNRQGRILQSFKDGRVSYRTDSGSIMVNREVSPEVNEVGSIRRSRSIIDNFNRIGLVQSVYEDGRVAYRTESGSTMINKDVSPEVDSLGNLSKSGRVVDNFNRVGIIGSVFEDGRVAYRTESGSMMINRDVSPAVAELNGARANIRVIDNFNRTGSVIDVFQDGRIHYRTESGSQMINREISPSVTQLSNGTRAGQTVIDNFNRIGTAIEVFRDGRVEYKTESGGSLMVNASVSREVDTHEKYVKQKEYASNRDIGEALRFFADGRIELKGDYTSICNELFEEVDEINGASRDTEVVMPSGEAKVENIFANSLARIVDKDGEKSNVKILDSSKIDSKGMRSTWLMVLNNQLASPDQKISLGAAILKTDYKKLLDLMKTDLSDRDTRFTAAEKKKLSDHIDAELIRIQ